jgi:ABC-type phosphate transport system substrate-binding protein
MRRIAALSCTAAAGLLGLIVVAPPAGAVSPNSRTITLAGSDTIFGVTGALVAQWNQGGAQQAAFNPDKSKACNTAPTSVLDSLPLATCNTGTANADSIPADKGTPVDAPAFTYGAGAPQVPYINGSTAGKAAICGGNASVNAVQGPTGSNVIDIARSSSSAATTCPANFNAFAVDGVSFVIGKTTSGGHGPPTYNLTDSDVTQIFQCQAATGAPTITDWGNVPAPDTGTAGQPIVRYVTNPASGTLAFFQSKYLGGASETANCTNDPNLRTPPPNGFIEENDMTVPTANNDKNNVIQFFSCAQFTAQKNKTLTDTRAGYKLIKVDGSTCKTLSGPTKFFSLRWVFYVIPTSTTQESAISQQEANNFGGFNTATGKAGFACSAASLPTITKYGFFGVPAADQNSGTCDLNPPTSGP